MFLYQIKCKSEDEIHIYTLVHIQLFDKEKFTQIVNQAAAKALKEMELEIQSKLNIFADTGDKPAGYCVCFDGPNFLDIIQFTLQELKNHGFDSAKTQAEYEIDADETLTSRYKPDDKNAKSIRELTNRVLRRSLRALTKQLHNIR